MLKFILILPMFVTDISSPNLNFLTQLESTLQNVYLIEANKYTNIKQLALKIQEYFVKNLSGQVIIIFPIDQLKSKGSAEKEICESLKKVIKVFSKKQLKINLLRVGEILEDKDSFINSTLEEIINNKTVLHREGHFYHYFVSKKDIINALEKLISSDISGETIDITLNKVSEEDVIRKLQEKYEFKTQTLETGYPNEKIINLRSSEKIKFKPHITLKDYINDTFTPINKETEQIQTATKEPIKPQVEHEKAGRGLILGFIAKNVVYITLIFFMLFSLEIAANNYLLYKNIQNNDTQKALFYAEKLRNLKLPTKWGENYLNIYNSIFYALNSLELYHKVLAQKEVDINTIETLKELSTKSLEFADEIEYSFLLTPQEKQIYKEYEFIFKDNNLIKKYLGVVDLIPHLDEKQKILILIQNSNELRPSGGFIGSYALLDVENFKIQEYKFDDIYNIDGTLEKDHAEILAAMPFNYQQFLNTEYVYARDLNLILDYKKRNNIALKYFEKALDTKIDTIVYTNLDTFKRILDITGPINIATYDEEFNAENFDTLVQIYSEQNYYEGSTQKKNILSLIGAKAIDRLQNINLKDEKVLKNLLDSLEKKEILVYSKNQEIQKTLENINLSNEITEFNSNYDYIYFIETNLGENKVNKKTERGAKYNLTYDQRRGLKLVDIEIELSNQANTYSWPYGNYKGILNVLLPNDITVTKIGFKNNNVGVVDITKSITAGEFSQFTNIEVPFSIKVEEKATIYISYEQKAENINKYSGLFVVKQPGNKEYPLEFSMNIPDIKEYTKSFTVDKDLKIKY